MSPFATTVIACALSMPIAFGEERTSVDLLLHSGKIYVLDEENSQASSMAVHDGKVLAVGGPEMRDQFQASEEVDLRGRVVMPGFNDSHIHISGKPRHYIDLSEVQSIEQIQSLVASKVNELSDGAWVTGYGWSEDELAEKRRPLISDLDAVAPNNPVMLTRAGAHSAVFSSTALNLAGIDRSSPDPEGGAIEKDDQGNLNGVIRERHEELVGGLIPAAPKDDLRASLAQELNGLFSKGITSITEAMTPIADYHEWEQVYAQHAGALPRASVQMQYESAEAIAQLGKMTGDGDDYLKVGPIKIFADGGFTGPAAYTKAPYRNEATYRGHLNMPEEELRELIHTVHKEGRQMGIHAIGDAAIELVVEYLDEVLTENPRADHRHYLNHFTVMPGAQTMRTMARQGIGITQQPNFAYTLEGRYSAYLDGDRLQHNNPMATPMKYGIHVAMSSDILPIGPWIGIYAASTRRGMSGQVYGEEEIISRFAALRAYTQLGAFLTREEGKKGTLEPGMMADFILLEHDPLLVPDEQLLTMKTLATYLAGRLVWQGDS